MYGWVRTRHLTALRGRGLMNAPWAGGLVLLVCVVVAMLLANMPATAEVYRGLLETDLSLVVKSPNGVIDWVFPHGMTVEKLVNDGLMVIFFFCVGLEIKREIVCGQLSTVRKAILPVLAAAGGMLAPAAVFALFNGGTAAANGWGIPTATDIAFALGILALLGRKVPNGVRVFLSTLAVADDIIAILVIAVFYGSAPDLGWLAGAAAVLVVLVVLNRTHVYSLYPYILVGAVLWFCVFMSGVHSTIAGVLLAFTIPIGSRVRLSSFLDWSRERVDDARSYYEDDKPVVVQGKYMQTVRALSRVSRQVMPPAVRLEQRLYPWVYFAVLPLFALTNADVAFLGGDMGALFTGPVFLGVLCGLLVGKPLGILLFSFLTVKLGIAKLPEAVTWKHMLGASILGGVGFTMAIFVANLAFADAVLVAEAKMAILCASLVAGVAGFVVLLRQAAKDPVEHPIPEDETARNAEGL